MFNIQSDLLDEYYGETLGRRLSLLQKKTAQEVESHKLAKDFFEDHHWHNSHRLDDELNERNIERRQEKRELLKRSLKEQSNAEFLDICITIQDKLDVTTAKNKRKQLVEIVMKYLEKNFRSLFLLPPASMETVATIDMFIRVTEKYLPRLLYADTVASKKGQYAFAREMIVTSAILKLEQFVQLADDPNVGTLCNALSVEIFK